MSTNRPNGTAHLEDDELLRLLDGEGVAAHPEWEAHIAGCARCAEAMNALRRDAHLLRDWLERARFEQATAADGSLGLLHAGHHAFEEDADVSELRAAARRPPAPRPLPRPQRGLPPWLRVAAVLALMATPVAAIPAFRQWIVHTVTGSTDEVPAVTSAPEAVAADTDVIRFTPAPGAFVVELTSAQRAGELRISRAEGADAVLQASDHAGALPVVSAAVLRIRNEADDETGYTLQLPAAVSSVTVRIGSRTVVIESGQIDAGTTVLLH